MDCATGPVGRQSNKRAIASPDHTMIRVLGARYAFAIRGVIGAKCNVDQNTMCFGTWCLALAT
eukprot:234137-Lingulodinium_polyedra.AAC.1